ncbi:hypothetical protein Q4485_12415 [Granulosicoccaceae sp. 1_MG-2023]|nr:hypothetical protein [Granulosicoccaceae sp. 1_MG-2023]
MSSPVLVHCHMFKNAGSTLDWSLERLFGKAFVDHRDDDPMRNEPGYLKTWLEAHPQVRALSSHHVPLPLPDLRDRETIGLFLLRQPLDRVGSVYQFEHKQKADTPGAIHAKKLGFGDYVAWRMQEDVGATIRDFQTRYCSGAMKVRKTGEAHFEQACAALAESPFVGVVDRYDESMVVFEEALRKIGYTPDLAYTAQNQGKRAALPMQERIDKVLDGLTPATRELLLANNELDIRLYAFANELLSARIAAIGDFDARLADFRKRCENPQAIAPPGLGRRVAGLLKKLRK